MSSKALGLAGKAMLLIFAVAPSGWGQIPLSVDELKEGFSSRYKQESVALRGWVATEKRVVSSSFKGYYLRDRFGSLILVRTTKPLPEITTEIQVTGVALQDADSGELYVAEVFRGEILKETAQEKEKPPARSAAPLPPAPKPVLEAKPATDLPKQPAQPPPQPVGKAPTPAPEKEGLETSWVLGLIGTGIVALIALAVYLSRRGSAQRSTYAAPAESTGVQASPVAQPTLAANPSFDDFKTVKVYKTSKVLPGQLVVLEGDRETDILYLSDQSGRGEIEIGRDSPDITGGIRIKDPSNTVSRRQARILYLPDRQQFQLMNLAGDSSNPTAVNGKVLRENEAVPLSDGDKIVMGSLTARFRAK